MDQNNNIVEKITVEEFIQQVWKVEHVKINITNVPDVKTALIDRYPYTESVTGDITVDEFLETRINPCLKTIMVPADNVIVTTHI